MNRREMFKRLAVGASAAATVAATRNDAHAAPDVEPVPTRWDFERNWNWCEMDVSFHAVQHALNKIGWSSGLAPKPLLCVHPAYYGTALEIASSFGGLIQVWATRDLGTSHPWRTDTEDIDAWCLAWRGRRVGSIGA